MTSITIKTDLPASVHLLNLGCGSSFHHAWINLDTFPAAPGVIRHDLVKGLPFSGETFDAVYSSHALEHFDLTSGQHLIKESHRVLKAGGIARIVVPDLETIARLYLSSLEGAVAGDVEAEKRYDWLMLELYDQTVRTAPGGNMQTYMRRTLDDYQNRFLLDRIGRQALRASSNAPDQRPLFWHAERYLRFLSFAMRRIVATGLVFIVLGRKGSTALKEGLFRQNGEIHQWMYDRFSLGRLLRHGGFEEVRICRAGESDILNFSEYGLEIVDGQERKPDSLYIEARKCRKV